MNGSLVQAKYSSALPERHTDFIFSSITEELGLVGALAVILLMCEMCIRDSCKNFRFLCNMLLRKRICKIFLSFKP